MKKKNLIFIVADAMCDYFIDKKIGDNYVCPFLHQYAKDNSRFMNVFSEGPYTMTALPSLFSYSHAMRANYKAFLSGPDHLVFSDLKKEGYTLYPTIYGWFIPPMEMIADGSCPNEYVIEEVISHAIPTIQYYIDRLKENDEYSDSDVESLRLVLSAVFSCSLSLFSAIENDNTTYSFGEEEYSKNDMVQIIEDEQVRFQRDYHKYIYMLLEEGIDSRLVFRRIKNGREVLSKDRIKEIESFWNKNRNTIRTIDEKQKLYNFFNDRYLLKDIIMYGAQVVTGKKRERSSSKTRLITYSKRLTNYNFNYSQLLRFNMVCAQGISSARHQFSTMADTISKHRDSDKPFFSYIHLMDTHYPFNFLTLDETNKLDSDMDNAYRMIKRIKRGEWRGSFAYLMSARYVDTCMGEFIFKLKQMGKLENTVVVFTADHGSIYGNSPLRDLSTGNNYHWESFHVPLIVSGADLPNVIHTYYAGSQIFPNLISSLGIQRDIKTDTDEKQYALFEYQGEGVPDAYRKPIIYGIRDEKILLVFRAKLTEEIGENNLIAGYDLVKDPIEDVLMSADVLKRECITYERLIRAVKSRHKKNREYFGIVS